MSKSVKKIPANLVEKGMYVAKLDRDWLGAPFLFQGFYIRTDDEINKLKTTCKHVYIDTERRDERERLNSSFNWAAIDTEGRDERVRFNSSSKCVDIDTKHGKPLPGAEQPTAWEDRQHETTGLSDKYLGEIVGSKRFFRQVSSMLAKMRPRASLKKELKRTGEIYQTVQRTVSNVMGELRAGGELDIAGIKYAVVPMINSVLRNPDAMACMVSMKRKDGYIYNHALATSVWSLVFGRHLGLDKVDLEALGMGGMLLDIGKTKIPTELLQKKGPLEKEESEELKRHVEYGLQILKDTKNVDSSVETMVRTHHERHDGSGYPEGLAGNDIPVFGRITGITDTYDAMTSVRPHAAAMSTYDVMRYLLSNANILFQAEIVERFIQVVGMFPTGTIIELNTGEVGIVVRQNPVRRLRPKVMLILDPDKNKRKDFPIIDLRKLCPDVTEPDAVWIVHGLDYGSFGIDPAMYYL